jgi:hypothetical protein
MSHVTRWGFTTKVYKRLFTKNQAVIGSIINARRLSIVSYSVFIWRLGLDFLPVSKKYVYTLLGRESCQVVHVVRAKGSWSPRGMNLTIS